MMQNIHAGKKDPITSMEGAREQPPHPIIAKQSNQAFPSSRTSIIPLLLALRALSNRLSYRRLLTQQIPRGIVEIAGIDPNRRTRLHQGQSSLGKLIVRRD